MGKNMTYIPKPSVISTNIDDGTLSPSKVVNTSAVSSVNTNVYNSGAQSFTGLTLSGSTGGLMQSYKTTAVEGITSSTLVNPSNSYHTVEISSSFTGAFGITHDTSSLGCVLVIKNRSGAAKNINGSYPSTTATASGSTTSVTLSAANSNIRVGQLITGPVDGLGNPLAIETGTRVVAISGTSLTLSLAPLATLSSTTLTFQSFIDFQWTGTALIPYATTISLANNASIRLISNGGVYWNIIGSS